MIYHKHTKYQNITFSGVINSKQILTKYSIIIILLACAMDSHAQADQLDFLRSTGKIYSVVALICSIFIGIILYLIRMDRKLSKLENQIHNESKTT